MREPLTAAEIAQIDSFDHWRAIRADDNAEMVRSLVKRSYLDEMDRELPPRDLITRRFFDIFRRWPWLYRLLRYRERVYRLNAWRKL